MCGFFLASGHLTMIQTTKATYLSRLFIVTSLVFTIQSCLIRKNKDDHGEVVGVSGRQGWEMETPFDMVFITGGSFMIGAVDQDIASAITRPSQVAVSSMYMDKCQVTNNKYRQFINALLEEAASVQQERNPSDTQEDKDTSSAAEDSSITAAGRTSRVLDEESIMKELYPDMSVWQNDFAHHMADRMVEQYYESPAFDDFPVVGITWDAAKYFAAWRTEYLNAYREKRGLWAMPKFRLPTAAEWTYAARGGKALAKYPWGGPYVRDAKGRLLANFKSNKGNYRECGYDYVSPVNHFAPNDYGLHIGGNVSEWTLDAYNPAAVTRMWDLNPVYLDAQEPRKVIKGGSWKDIARFLQTDVVDCEHKDNARSYIGFRCMMPHIGEEPANN